MVIRWWVSQSVLSLSSSPVVLVPLVVVDTDGEGDGW